MASLIHGAMLDKLKRNRGKLHWRDPSVTDEYLIGRLREEVDELEEAVRSGDVFAVYDEAGDVANFAGMLLERKTS